MSSVEGSIFEPLCDGFSVVDGALEGAVGYGIVPIAASLAVIGVTAAILRRSYNGIIGTQS